MVKKFYKTKNYDVRNSIGYLIRTGGNLITSKIEALFAETDLTFIQYVVLMNLRYNLANNSGELCNNMRYDSGAITRVIDQLERRKLLERHRCTTDRRVVNLHLTDAGAAMLESLLPIVVDLYNGWLEDFTQDEAETLIRLLTKLLARVSADEGKA